MLYFTLANERQRRTIQHPQGPIEFGRGPERSLPRIVIEDRFTSRDQVRIEELATGDVRVENLGSVVTVVDNGELATHETRVLRAPLRLTFGYTILDIGVVPSESTDQSLRSLAPRANDTLSPSIQTHLSLQGESPSAETLASWFATLLKVQRAAAGSGEFYTQTARAVVELVGLDRGLVLLKRGEAWEIVAQHTTRERPTQTFSRTVLQQVEVERRTYFQNFQVESVTQSLVGIEAVVASPIFDEHDAVIGAVFGSRDGRTVQGQRGIQPLEAQFVQLLAGAVSAGLARMASEAETARARVQFEQFFSPELARALEIDQGILAAQERELTLLFADLRGFSRISERVGARETYNLLSDILDRLTNHVMDHGGVVIDYYGDGLAAMWNAPTPIADHAQRAAQAALAMQSELPAINLAWAERLGGLVRLGVGINTGVSQVGNAGSRRRLKYGPRGHAVNLASRVEGATKVLGVPVLVTESTQRLLGDTFHTRRLCQARVTGMVQPLALYELAPQPPAPQWLAMKPSYEQALAHFEQGQASTCLTLCQSLQTAASTGDVPTQLLLAKAQAQLASPTPEFDPVYSLETK